MSVKRKGTKVLPGKKNNSGPLLAPKLVAKKVFETSDSEPEFQDEFSDIEFSEDNLDRDYDSSGHNRDYDSSGHKDGQDEDDSDRVTQFSAMERMKQIRPEAHGQLPSTSGDPALEEMKEIMIEVKDLLKQIAGQMKQNMITPHDSSSSSSTEKSLETTPKRFGKMVPLNIRQETRRVYSTLVDDDSDFDGWDLSHEAMFKSPRNSAVTARIINEVKTLNPDFPATAIRDAAYRFFRTKKEAEKNSTRGREDRLRTTKRRHERIVRKRRDRESAIIKSSKLSQDQKDKWLKVVTNEFMSTEESDGDELIVHKIPWRSRLVETMFEKIDQKLLAASSGKSKRLKKSRKIGNPSNRTSPTPAPSWAIEH